MRVTTRMMTDKAIAFNAKNLERLSEAQAEVATGKRVRDPHDGPVAAGRRSNWALKAW